VFLGDDAAAQTQPIERTHAFPKAHHLPPTGLCAPTPNRPCVRQSPLFWDLCRDRVRECGKHPSSDHKTGGIYL